MCIPWVTMESTMDITSAVQSFQLATARSVGPKIGRFHT